MDYAKEAERHREIAGWYRTLADETRESALRDCYRELAASYDRLADNEAELGGRRKLAS